MEAVLEQVRAIVARVARVAPAQVKPDGNLRNDLGLDSLQIVEVVLDVEQRFDLTIPDPEIGHLHSAQALAEYVQSAVRLAATAAAAVDLTSLPHF